MPIAAETGPGLVCQPGGQPGDSHGRAPLGFKDGVGTSETGTEEWLPPEPLAWWGEGTKGASRYPDLLRIRLFPRLPLGLTSAVPFSIIALIALVIVSREGPDSPIASCKSLIVTGSEARCSPSNSRASSELPGSFPGVVPSSLRVHFRPPFRVIEFCHLLPSGGFCVGFAARAALPPAQGADFSRAGVRGPAGRLLSPCPGRAGSPGPGRSVPCRTRSWPSGVSPRTPALS